MKVSLVGCGGISLCHLEAIKKISGVELCAVADIIPERANKTAKKYGCKAFTDYIEMLEEENPDSIHICTPHYLHVPMAAQALKRNINVLSEKPCAITKTQLSLIEQAQNSSTAQYGVCFQNRYNPSVVKLKKIIDSGKYGKINSVRAIVTWRRDADYYNSDDWRGTLNQEGGGVLINQAIHTQDLITYLTGKTVNAVTATVSNKHLKNDIEVEDTADMFIEFSDGTRGVYFASNSAGVGMSPLIDISCEEATFRIEGDNLYELGENGILKTLYNKADAKKTLGKLEWGNSHEKLIKDFYSHINSGEKFPIDALEAGKAVKLILAAYDSSAQQTRIEL